MSPGRSPRSGAAPGPVRPMSPLALVVLLIVVLLVMWYLVRTR